MYTTLAIAIDPAQLKVAIPFIGFLILSLGIHEAAHAWVANLRGDDTAKLMGRMTINPWPHIDPFMTVALPLLLFLGSNGTMLFGGAKPVPVIAPRLKNPLRDMMLVAIAGPLSNFLLAFVFAGADLLCRSRFGYESAEVLPSVLQRAAAVNVVLLIFNMIPIPPLDGSRVMTWLMPASLREPYNRLGSIGILLVMLLMFSGLLGPVLRSSVLPVLDFVYDTTAKVIL